MISHASCDTALLTVCLFITLQYYSVSDINRHLTTTISSYPNVYHGKFEYTENVNVFFTTGMYLIGLYAILKLDYGEFLANPSSVYNVIELTLGFLSVFYNIQWLTSFYLMFTIATAHQKQIVYFMGPWYMRIALNHFISFLCSYGINQKSIKSIQCICCLDNNICQCYNSSAHVFCNTIHFTCEKQWAKDPTGVDGSTLFYVFNISWVLYHNGICHFSKCVACMFNTDFHVSYDVSPKTHAGKWINSRRHV